MSNRFDRKSAPLAWHPQQSGLVLQIIAHNRKIAELMATVARMRGGGAELERAKQKFWERGIEALIPVPGQSHDTALTDTVITKRSTGSMPSYGLRGYFGRVQRCYRAQGGMICEAAVRCSDLSPAMLVKACASAEKQSLDQMLGHDRPAGFIVSADVDGNVVRVRAMVTDAVAMAKLSKDVYSGVVVQFDEDDRLHRMSLYDTDQIEKVHRANVICKFIDREEVEMTKKLRKKAAKLSRQTGHSHLMFV
jgi:hypothetical protein